MKVKICANCLKQIKKCDCVVKVVETADECPNCKDWVSEEDNYCSVCGFNLYEDINKKD